MKIEYSYAGVTVSVELNNDEMGEVNPYDIVTKIADLAHAVGMYESGHINIKVQH